MATNINGYSTGSAVQRPQVTVIKNKVASPYGGKAQYDELVNSLRSNAAPPQIQNQLRLAQVLYVSKREKLPADVHAGFVKDLYPTGYEFGPEALWFAGRLTVDNVTAVIDHLIDPVLIWYQQEYEKTYGYSNLHAAKGLFKTMYACVPSDVKHMYRRDADLMICITVLSELFQVLKMKDDLDWLNMRAASGNWESLVGHVDAVLSALVHEVFPLIGVNDE